MWTNRLRLTAIALRWLLRERKRPPVAVSRVAFRCWPWDCDFNLHMNNGRYLGLMDVARFHSTMANGFLRQMLRERIVPLIVETHMVYKRGLKPGQRFEVETSLTRVEGKVVEMRQAFYRGEELVAEARVVCLFSQGGKVIEVGALLEAYPHLVAALEREPALA